MKIALAGFHIESCTFSPLISSRRDFQVLRGSTLLANFPFLSVEPDVEVVPLVYTRALPGGPVDRNFYESIKGEILNGLRTRGPFDGIFLPMHGAVSVQGMQDAEGDLLSAIRNLVGPDCFISAGYDLHGNVSQPVFDCLDFLSAYRTAPHVDTRETLERAFQVQVRCIREKIRPAKAWASVPILLPGEMTSTEWQPAARLYQQIPTLVQGDAVLDVSLLIGYVWADEPRSTAAVAAYGLDPAAVSRAVTSLANDVWAARHEFQFGVPTFPVDECIRQAVASPEMPVIISDSGDNPTAGGAGDIPFVLERLLALGVDNALVAGIADPAAVQICEEAGVGKTVHLKLGGKLDPLHGQPLAVEARVESLHGQPWGSVQSGDTVLLNRIAIIAVNGARVILTERRTPFHHRADFTDLGLTPETLKIIVVKIGYLEPELKEMAAKALLALSPGAVNQDILALPYEHIQRPMFPFDPEMEWTARVRR